MLVNWNLVHYGNPQITSSGESDHWAGSKLTNIPKNTSKTHLNANVILNNDENNTLYWKYPWYRKKNVKIIMQMHIKDCWNIKKNSSLNPFDQHPSLPPTHPLVGNLKEFPRSKSALES